VSSLCTLVVIMKRRAKSRQINFEMCCQTQLLHDAAKRSTDNVVFAGADEIASTKAEIGTPEMGWFSLAAYIEEEEWHSQGHHKR
jgi:hypothetical protein